MDSAAPAPAAPPPADANRTTLDASEASATSDLYRAAIGAIHTDRYQRIFERFESADRSMPHWNWAAAFVTLNWMAFRGLWGAALAYVGAVSTAVLLLFGIGRLVYAFSNEALWAASALLLLLTIAIPGLWGNALLYAATRKRMAQALAANHTVPQACAMLLRGASSRKRALWLALANATLVAAVLGFVLNMPSATHRPPANVSEASASVQGPVLVTSAPEPASSAMVAASAPGPVASAPTAAPIAVPASEPVALTASAPAATASVATVVVAPPEVPAVTAAPASSPAPAAASKKPVNPAPAKAKAPPVAPATQSAPVGPKFFANAGLFANAANAKNVHEKLLEAGMQAFTQQVSGPRGNFTRVRVGPFKTREEAVAAVMKIRGLGLDAEIVNPP